MNGKQICKAAGFLLVIVLLVAYLTNLLSAKWRYTLFEGITFPEYYEVESDSIEVCIIGSSQIISGIDNMALYGDYGISAYSFGSATQPMMASYAWLKECNKKHDVQVAILDVSTLYEESTNAEYRRAFDKMKLSLEKVKLLREYCSSAKDADPLATYIFPIIKYHTRWEELEKKDFALDQMFQPLFRGFYLNPDKEIVSLRKIVYDTDEYDEELEMVEVQKQYLDRIVEYCNEENIELLFIKTPKNDWSITKHTQVQEYADANNVEFLDFSSLELVKELELDGYQDFVDAAHLNFSGAQKLTAWLGAYLQENYELTDCRQEDGHDDLGYDRYLECVEDTWVRMCTDITQYASLISSDRYEVLVQFTDSSEFLYSESVEQLLVELGSSVKLTDIVGQRYGGWFRNGECVYENVSEEDFQYTNKLTDGTDFALRCNFAEDASHRMRIDYENESFSHYGCNILIYDSRNSQMIDKCTIYYDEETAALQMTKYNGFLRTE